MIKSVRSAIQKSDLLLAVYPIRKDLQNYQRNNVPPQQPYKLVQKIEPPRSPDTKTHSKWSEVRPSRHEAGRDASLLDRCGRNFQEKKA